MRKVTNKEWPLVSVVIPTHNRKEKLVRLIKSILESNYPKDKLEIIVVDDASTDGTYEHIKKLFPQIKVIRNEREKLVAESRNIGIRASKGKYIFMIDDDNVVDKNTIVKLVEYLENHPEVGIAGPIMYFLSDSKRIWCAGIKRNYWTTITRYIAFNTTDNDQFKEPYKSEDFPNAFMVRREVFEKAGLFNSKLFPIHYEESDFCQRVKRAGYKIILVPVAKIWHDIPVLSKKDNLFKNPLRAYYAARNRIIFHWLWSNSIIQKLVSLFSSIIINTYYVIVNLRNGANIAISLMEGTITGLRDIKLVSCYKWREY